MKMSYVIKVLPNTGNKNHADRTLAMHVAPSSQHRNMQYYIMLLRCKNIH